MTGRVRITAIRDPDDGKTIGWIAECPGCRGVALTNTWRKAFQVANCHCCPHPAEPRRPRWRYPWGGFR